MDLKNESEIQLGEQYRDTVTGFEGTAVGRHQYLHGCERITLQAMTEGGDIKEYSFDTPALAEVGKDGAGFTSERTGGPRSAPPSRPTR